MTTREKDTGSLSDQRRACQRDTGVHDDHVHRPRLVGSVRASSGAADLSEPCQRCTGTQGGEAHTPGACLLRLDRNANRATGQLRTNRWDAAVGVDGEEGVSLLLLGPQIQCLRERAQAVLMVDRAMGGGTQACATTRLHCRGHRGSIRLWLNNACPMMTACHCTNNADTSRVLMGHGPNQALKVADIRIDAVMQTHGRIRSDRRHHAYRYRHAPRRCHAH